VLCLCGGVVLCFGGGGGAEVVVMLCLGAVWFWCAVGFGGVCLKVSWQWWWWTEVVVD
jgi:hypothetical protein